MTYALSKISLARLMGVADPLVRVVGHAISNSPQDFMVAEGLRSDDDQLKAWLTKHSKLNGIAVGLIRYGFKGTGRGNHQAQLDGPFKGLSEATDLVPIVNGAPNFEDWKPFFVVARAMRDAARAEGVTIRWGADWDRTLNDLGDDLEAEMNAYKIRHPGPDFLDGPHFELHS